MSIISKSKRVRDIILKNKKYGLTLNLLFSMTSCAFGCLVGLRLVVCWGYGTSGIQRRNYKKRIMFCWHYKHTFTKINIRIKEREIRNMIDNLI